MTDLSDLFAEQQSNIINWQGMSTYGLFEFDEVPSRFQLRFVSAKDSPVQGIRLKTTGGVVEINGQQNSEVVLWEDSAPDVIEVSIRIDDQATSRTLKLWNVWRVGLDVTQAWVGNAAIQIDGDPSSGSFSLHCSDGQGEPNFRDLVLDVQVLEV